MMETKAAFRSGPVHVSPEADVIVVHCSDPRYQPHFQQFLNTALGLGHYGLIAVPGGKPEQIVSLKSYRQTGLYGFWFALTPDDTPLTLRDAGTQEIVSMKWTAP